MKKHLLLLPVLCCFALFPPLTATARDAGPSLEETRRFIQGKLDGSSVFSALKTEEGKPFSLRTSYSFSKEVVPVQGADGCTLSFAQNFFSAPTREKAAAEHFPQNSSIVDIFMGGGDLLKIDSSEQSGLLLLRITPLGGDDFISTRLHQAGYESTERTGHYLRKREGVSDNQDVVIGVATQDDATRLQKAFERMLALCADARAPEGFGKSLF